MRKLLWACDMDQGLAVSLTACVSRSAVSSVLVILSSTSVSYLGLPCNLIRLLRVVILPDNALTIRAYAGADRKRADAMA